MSEPGISYLDHASVGRPTPATLDAVHRATHRAAELTRPGTERTLELVEEVERCRALVARLLGVSPEDVALVENTTQALGLLASSFALKPEESVAVPDADFISCALVWRRAQRRSGFELRPVRTSGCLVELRDVERVVDESTRFIVTSSVQEVSGHRLDLTGLMSLAEDCGAYLIIDGIQEAGVLRRDLSETPVHAYCAGGHKWLGSPFGLGFMYVHPELRERCDPPFDGYFNLREPDGGWGAYLESRERSAFDELAEVAGASRFESGGMPNWPGAVALGSAVEELLEEGVESVEARSLQLRGLLMEGLDGLGLRDFVLGSRERGRESAIVTFGLPGGLESERRLLHRLVEEKVFVSLRSACGAGGIRVSPHARNTTGDLRRLLQIAEDFLEKED